MNKNDIPDNSSGRGLGMDGNEFCGWYGDDDEERLAFNGDLYLCMEGLSLFLIFNVDFVPGPALASTT